MPPWFRTKANHLRRWPLGRVGHQWRGGFSYRKSMTKRLELAHVLGLLADRFFVVLFCWQGPPQGDGVIGRVAARADRIVELDSQQSWEQVLKVFSDERLDCLVFF